MPLSGIVCSTVPGPAEVSAITIWAVNEPSVVGAKVILSVQLPPRKVRYSNDADPVALGSTFAMKSAAPLTPPIRAPGPAGKVVTEVVVPPR